MTPYRGIIQIECTVKGECMRGVRKDVRADCTACPEAITRIVALDGKVLHESRALEAVPEAPPVKKAGKKKGNR